MNIFNQLTDSCFIDSNIIGIRDGFYSYSMKCVDKRKIEGTRWRHSVDLIEFPTTWSKGNGEWKIYKGRNKNGKRCKNSRKSIEDIANIIKAADKLQVVHLRQDMSWGMKQNGREFRGSQIWYNGDHADIWDVTLCSLVLSSNKMARQGVGITGWSFYYTLSDTLFISVPKWW